MIDIQEIGVLIMLFYFCVFVFLAIHGEFEK